MKNTIRTIIKYIGSSPSGRKGVFGYAKDKANSSESDRARGKDSKERGDILEME